jgi:hypothetical protein
MINSKQIGQLYDLMGELWLVGSDDVVQAVLAWRQRSTSSGSRQESLVKLAGILIAMRKDLGDTSGKSSHRIFSARSSTR